MRNGQSGHVAKIKVADPSWTDLSTVACSKSGWNRRISRTPEQGLILNQKWLGTCYCGCTLMEISKGEMLSWLVHACCVELHIDPTIIVHFLVYACINGDVTEN